MLNVIIGSVSQPYNDLLNYFSGQWTKALKKLSDVHVLEVHFDTMSEIDQDMINMMKSPNCAMLCYNTCGVGITDGDDNIWDKYDVDVYTLFLDHPRNYYKSLEEPSENLHVVCLDENHVEFVKRFFPKVKDVIFLPDSGVQECKEIVPFGKRSIDVLYCGNCQKKYDRIPTAEYLPNNGIYMYDKALSYMYKDSSLTAEAAVERYLSENGLCRDDDTLYDLFINKQVSRVIEDIVRRDYKLMIMHALDAAGIKVDIYGGRWEDDENPFSDNIRIHPRVNPLECHKLIGDAKIDLSIMPWFKRGSSEKPFGGMLNGAVCVSDTSTYLEENYLDGIDIMLFDLDHIEKAAQDIKWLLDNPEEAEIIAQNGYRHAMENDSTDARILQIVEIMKKRR